MRVNIKYKKNWNKTNILPLIHDLFLFIYFLYKCLKRSGITKYTTCFLMTSESTVDNAASKSFMELCRSNVNTFPNVNIFVLETLMFKLLSTFGNYLWLLWNSEVYFSFDIYL